MILLIGFGVVMGYLRLRRVRDQAPVAPVKTLIWTTIGLIIFFVAASIDYHWLQTLTVPIYAIVLGLLTLTMLIGTNLFGAQMSITVAGLDFQFSEVSKVLMIVVLASFLASRGEDRQAVDPGRRGAADGHPTFLVFKQPDLGTALVFVAILVGMLFMSGASIGWMALLARRWRRRRSWSRRCRTTSARASSASLILTPTRRGRATSWSRR